MPITFVCTNPQCRQTLTLEAARATCPKCGASMDEVRPSDPEGDLSTIDAKPARQDSERDVATIDARPTARDP